MGLKRLCNVKCDDGIVIWCTSVTYGSTDALKNVCQECGEVFFGETNLSYVTSDDAFCDPCLSGDTDSMYVNVTEKSRIELVDTNEVGIRSSRRSHKNLEKIKEESHYTCFYCEYSPLKYPGCGIPIHADHIIPFSCGGSNALDNLVCSCGVCNSLASSNVFSTLTDKKAFVLRKRRARNLPIGDDEWIEYVRNPFADSE